MVAAAKPVVEGEERLLAALAAQAYPLARVIDRKVVVDHAARSMTVDWRIDTGPYARFDRRPSKGSNRSIAISCRRACPGKPANRSTRQGR